MTEENAKNIAEALVWEVGVGPIEDRLANIAVESVRSYAKAPDGSLAYVQVRRFRLDVRVSWQDWADRVGETLHVAGTEWSIEGACRDYVTFVADVPVMAGVAE